MNTQVIIDIKTASVVAVLNAWEDGDRWDKIIGCDSCPIKDREKCCGNCHWLEKGATCRWQNVGGGGVSKTSLFCITHPLPLPDVMFSPCALEFKCVKGSKKILDKIRRPRDKRGVLI